jgi:hypothetical protein
VKTLVPQMAARDHGGSADRCLIQSCDLK